MIIGKIKIPYYEMALDSMVALIALWYLYDYAKCLMGVYEYHDFVANKLKRLEYLQIIYF